MRISDWSSDVCSSDLSLYDQALRTLWLGCTRRLSGTRLDAGLCRQSGSEASLAYGLPSVRAIRRSVPVGRKTDRGGAEILTLRQHRFDRACAPIYSALELRAGSEERRVGRECGSTCRCRRSTDHEKKKQH